MGLRDTGVVTGESCVVVHYCKLVERGMALGVLCTPGISDGEEVWRRKKNELLVRHGTLDAEKIHIFLYLKAMIRF